MYRSLVSASSAKPRWASWHTERVVCCGGACWRLGSSESTAGLWSVYVGGIDGAGKLSTSFYLCVLFCVFVSLMAFDGFGGGEYEFNCQRDVHHGNCWRMCEWIIFVRIITFYGVSSS